MSTWMVQCDLRILISVCWWSRPCLCEGCRGPWVGGRAPEWWVQAVFLITRIQSSPLPLTPFIISGKWLNLEPQPWHLPNVCLSACHIWAIRRATYILTYRACWVISSAWPEPKNARVSGPNWVHLNLHTNYLYFSRSYFAMVSGVLSSIYLAKKLSPSLLTELQLHWISFKS